MDITLESCQPALLAEFLDRDAIYDSIFGHCTPAAIFRFGRTCRLARRAVQDYTGRAFDINRSLSRFFTMPFEFRLLQARTNAVISGSTALQFMDRTLYEKSDLDIYVTWPYALQVCRWVTSCGGKGYVFHPARNQVGETWEEIMGSSDPAEENPPDDIDYRASDWGSYNWNRVKRVFNFKSTTQTESEPLYIQVIVTMTTPMDCMLSFHSTVVMNAITYYAAYSMYPKGSFEERRALVCDTKEVRHEHAIAKYRGRGWEMETAISREEQLDPTSSFRFENRWVGDKKTWIIPLSTDNIVRTFYQMGWRSGSLPLSIDPFSLNSFSIRKDPNNALVEVKYSVLKPSFFEHRYTACFDFSHKMSCLFSMVKKIRVKVTQNQEMQKCDSALRELKQICMREGTCNFRFEEDKRRDWAAILFLEN